MALDECYDGDDWEMEMETTVETNRNSHNFTQCAWRTVRQSAAIHKGFGLIRTTCVSSLDGKGDGKWVMWCYAYGIYSVKLGSGSGMIILPL